MYSRYIFGEIERISIMNDTRALLEFIYKNAEMGRKTVHPLIDLSDNDEFKNVLSRMVGDYSEICAKSDLLLRENGMDEASGLNMMEKIMTEFSLRMNTIKDHSVRHIADMLVKGASMGMSDISKKLEEHPDADQSAKDLAKRLLKLNSDTIDEMKKFLTVAQ